MFGVFVFADDRFTEPTFGEGVAVGRVFTKEELFKKEALLNTLKYALSSDRKFVPVLIRRMLFSSLLMPIYSIDVAR